MELTFEDLSWLDVALEKAMDNETDGEYYAAYAEILTRVRAELDRKAGL